MFATLMQRTISHLTSGSIVEQEHLSFDSSRLPVLRLVAVAMGFTGLLATLIPASPVKATANNDYEVCAASLLRTGLSPAVVADACAEVLHPEDLAACVTQIDARKRVEATQALLACVKVRRPLELATCFNAIDTNTSSPVALEVLDHCRRSLLPVRFSECVLGLSSKITLTPATAMTTCIDALDRPRDVFPNFIPAGSES